MTEYPDAARLMAGPLGQWLHGQTAVREDAKKRANDRLWTIAIIALPAIAFVYIAFSVDLGLILQLGVLAGGGAWYWSQAPKREAVKQVKTGINEAIAEGLGLQYQHDVKGSPGFLLAKSFKMLPNYDRASFEDRWSGTYAGHPFVLHEAHLEERRGSGKNRRWITVFRGAILTIGFNRDFHGSTLVSRAKQHKSFLGLGSRKNSIKVDGQQLDYVDMVHPDFESSFDVYSTDQVEARYIVHPMYIERLIGIEQVFSGDSITSLFHGGELVIALNCGNMFESGAIDASEDHERVRTTIEQFARLADLATSLQEPSR